MYKNYFILNRFVFENKAELTGGIITEIFSQERDKLVIKVNKNEDDLYLEISVNPGFPYILINDDFHRAKKNSIDFFEKYLPAEITGFKISDSDRIIKIILKDASVYFTIRGKFTNVFLLDNNSSVSFFKKYPDETIPALLSEMKSNNFIDERNIPDLSLINDSSFADNVRKRYPFISKDIINELKARTGNSSDYAFALKTVIKEILELNPVVCFNDNLYELYLSIKGFSKTADSRYSEFDKINAAVAFFLHKKYYYDSSSHVKKRILKYLEREISKISHKLNDIKGLLDRGSKEELYSKIGNLLLINIKKLRSGMKEMEIADIFEDNKVIKIKLDEKLSPRRNVDRYFEKARGDRKLIERSEKIYDNLQKKLIYLKEFELKIREEENIQNLYKYMKELKMKGQNNTGSSEDIKTKFKHYIIENKYHLYVGKDSANNDLLTTKFAKQNDYWFHARSLPGSHAVLRAENPKEAVPKSVLKKAASIAAFHSKAKTSGTAPVSYTLKKYVVKKKGMEPGKVALLKEEVLLVKPGIPKDCEYVSSD